ncbi:MAG: hypothetical protein ACPHM0_04005, partial [Flavobacteriales bacterium]
MKAFFAIVYELCLDGACVAKDDPLYETSYIGQAGRYASSAEEALEMRWQNHKSDAKNHPREQGIRWGLNKYGPAAFTRRVICFLKFEKRCIEALDYMNAVEIEEIDCRGGIMQDIDPPAPVWQTFNLDIGGQGDATSRFASLQAGAERTWKKFQEKVLELVAETGTCQCRADYKSKCGYGLGMVLAMVRSKRRFLDGAENEAEREKFLEDLPGWSWAIRADMHANSWEVFKRELLDHVKEFGTAYVRQSYVSASGYPLGKTVSRVRRGGFLDNGDAEERREWLNTLPGWVWDATNSIEGRRLAGSATSKRRHDPVHEGPRQEKAAETVKRKREERWATLNEVELAEAKHMFERRQKADAKTQEKRKAKARGEAPEPKKPRTPMTDRQLRNYEKVKADLAAVKATLFP